MKFTVFLALLALQDPANAQASSSSSSSALAVPSSSSAVVPPSSSSLVFPSTSLRPVISSTSRRPVVSSTRSRTSRTTRSVRSTTTTTSGTPLPTGNVGSETLSIVRVNTVLGKRQARVNTQVVSIAFCPIAPTQVPNVPCYPCAVGLPVGQQSLGVRTTSTLDVAPDVTPTYTYSFCAGCQNFPTAGPVPGYVAGSRNLASCIIQPGPQVTTTRRIKPTTTSTWKKPATTTTRGFVVPPFSTGYTTNIYVTVTAFNYIQVNTVNGGGVTNTIYAGSTIFVKQPTSVVIPASLCTTYTTLTNGIHTVWTTPLPVWTQCLTTLSTSTSTCVSTVTVQSTQAVTSCLPTGYVVVPTWTPTAAPVPAVTQAPPVVVTQTAAAISAAVNTQTADAISAAVNTHTADAISAAVNTQTAAAISAPAVSAPPAVVSAPPAVVSAPPAVVSAPPAVVSAPQPAQPSSTYVQVQGGAARMAATPFLGLVLATIVALVF